LIAACEPAFAWRSTRKRGSPRATSSAIAPVASLEPSSITTTSNRSKVCACRLASASPT